MSIFARQPQNRKDRREQERRDRAERKQQEAADKWAAWKAMSPEERAHFKQAQEAVDRIQRNGITIEELEQNYKLGYDAGVKDGCERTFETVFAAICLALHELHGFGSKRCMRVLNLVHDKTYYALSRQDIIDEVWATMKLRINFKNDVGEVVERE